jgi:class 3 adenylate cyclase
LEEQNLLNNLLPVHVLDKFINNQKMSLRAEFTEFITNVTILFADIAGFTKYSSSVEPE